MPQHYTHFSIAKALCIIIVVMGHAGLGTPGGGMSLPCFFLLSGYFLKDKHLDDPIAFAKRRIKTLWWPWTKIGLVLLLLHNVFVSWGWYDNPYTLLGTAAKAVKIAVFSSGIDGMGGFWFVKELFFLTFIVYLLLLGMRQLPIYKTVSAYGGVILTLLFVVVSHVLYSHNIYGFHRYVWFVGTKTLIASSFFTAGFTLAKLPVTRKSNLWLGLACVAATYGLSRLGLVGQMSTIDGIRHVPTFFATGLLGTCGIVNCSAYIRGWLGRALDLVGQRTLYILALHMLTFKLVSAALVAANCLPAEALQDEYPHSGAWLPLYIAAGIVLPILAYQAEQAINKKTKRKLT